MGILDGIAKGLTLSSAAGFATHYVLTKQLKVSSPLVCTLGTGCAAVSGLIYYSRVWIQGYWWDKSYRLTQDLTGKCAVVTGCTYGGIGYAAAELLAAQGATVIITCRSSEKGQDAVQRLEQSTAKTGRIHCVYIDFLSNQSVRNGAKEIAKLTNRLDFLILNAGVARGKPSLIWQTNHVGPFLLTKEVSPLLTKTAALPNAQVRVVSVSSGAHKQASIHWQDPFSPPKSEGGKGQKLFAGPYGQSKLANIMHMRELQRQFHDNNNKNIQCYSVTPGAVQTNIMSGGQTKMPWPMRLLAGCILRTPTVGAQVILMACLDRAIPPGSYLSNCCVKPTEGLDGCSNDEAQWKKLWELTERQIQENKFA